MERVRGRKESYQFSLRCWLCKGAGVRTQTMWFGILHIPVGSANVSLHLLSASQGQEMRGPKVSVVLLDIYLQNHRS